MHVKTVGEWKEEREELLDCLIEFSQIMKRRPFQNEAGLRGVSAFALFWYARKLQPAVVFEVGVWRGFSTWLIEQASPRSEIWSFDPIFFFGGEPSPTYRSPRAKYFREDFSCADLSGVVAGADTALAFFDDHHRQLARLEQGRRVGIEHFVFDDNPPFPYSNRTLEDERAEPRSSALLARLADRYEVFPALWAVDDAHEYHVREPGLDFPITDDLIYIYGERKWHSYMTYVHATPDLTARSQEGDLTDSYGGLRPVQMQSTPSPTSAAVSADDGTLEQIRQLAAASSAAISNLDRRLIALQEQLTAAGQGRD